MAAQNDSKLPHHTWGGGGGVQTLLKLRPFKWQHRMKSPRHTLGGGGGGAETLEATSIQMAAQNEVTSSYIRVGGVGRLAGGGGVQTLLKQRPFKWQHRMESPRRKAELC